MLPKSSLLPPPGTRPKPMRASDVASFQAAKSLLDESMGSIEAFKKHAEPMMAKLLVQQVTTIQEREELERQAPALIESRLVAAQNTSSAIQVLSKDLSTSIHKFQEKQTQLKPTIAKLSQLVKQAAYAQNAGNYVKLVVHIGQITNGIENLLHQLNQKKPYLPLIKKSITLQQQHQSSINKDASKPVALQTEFDSVNELMGRKLLDAFLKLLEFDVFLKPLTCENLKQLLGAEIKSLSGRIEAVFKLWYQACLEALSWPTPMAEADDGTYNETSLSYFRSAFVLLVKFQQSLILANSNSSDENIPTNLLDQSLTTKSSSLSSNHHAASSSQPSSQPEKLRDRKNILKPLPTLWCIELLLKPLELRFNYNFRGRESTNRFDRPEWHFTYTRNLLKNHGKFLEFVTSLLQSLGLVAYDASHEILKGMIVLIKEKLLADMNLISASGPSAPSTARDPVVASSHHSLLSQAAPTPLSKLPLNIGSILGGSGSIKPALSMSGGMTSSSGEVGVLGGYFNKYGTDKTSGGSKSKSGSTIGGGGGLGSSQTILLGEGNNTSTKVNQFLAPEVVEALLSHTINEILDFEKTLTNSYEYPLGRPEEYPRPIDVLTVPEYYRCWLDLELRAMRQHFREALDSPDGWKRQYSSVPIADDPTRVPRHCHVFFSVLSIVQERYSLLGVGREELMSEFLEGQINLISDYLDELKDLQAVELRSLTGKEFISRCCTLYNAVWYCRKVLEEWGNNVFYLELYMWNQHITDIDKLSGTVFDPILQQCKAFCKHMMNLMIEEAFTIISGSFKKSYVKKNFLEEQPCQYIEESKENVGDGSNGIRNGDVTWQEDDFEDDFENPKKNSSTIDSTAKKSHTVQNSVFDVSPQICEVIFLLQQCFSTVENTLNVHVFHKFWKSLAAKLNTFILEQVIFKKHFNDQGATQLKTDINAFWVIWTSQTAKPESYFKETNEAISILTMSLNDYYGLSDILSQLSRNANPQQLSEASYFGLSRLSASQAKQVLDKRVVKS